MGYSQYPLKPICWTLSSSNMVKLLLCGQVNGQWDAIFERAKKLNAGAKAAPFEALLVVGGVFPFPAAYLSQEKSVPVPTYFVSSGEKEASWSEDEQQKAVYDQMAKADSVCTEIVPNLFFLGSSGIAKVRMQASGWHGQLDLTCISI